MRLIESVDEMQGIAEQLRSKGKRISFVPTMGALHAGHERLMEVAALGGVTKSEAGLQEEPSVKEVGQQLSSSGGSTGKPVTVGDQTRGASIVVVSIFVNVSQFNEHNDLVNYSRTLDKDLEICKRLGVDYVFAPDAEEIYPTYSASLRANKTGKLKFNDCSCTVSAPNKLMNDLEGHSRPGHFTGVLTIVCKLFNIVKPHDAYFGEKDYQQFAIIKRMAKDLNTGVTIHPVATVRDSTLLPLSSRNVKLTQPQRRIAEGMWSILSSVRDTLQDKTSLRAESCDHDLDAIMLGTWLTTKCLNPDYQLSDPMKVDYLALRCSAHFAKIFFKENIGLFDCREGCIEHKLSHSADSIVLKARILIAVLIDGIRLLDNVEVELNT